MIFLYFLHTFHLMAKIYMPICPHCQKITRFQGGANAPHPKRNPARTCTCKYIYYTLTCTFFTCIYISVYDKLIWRTIGPKNFFFGQVAQLITVILSVTALTLS